MSSCQKTPVRLILIYILIFIFVFQYGVDFQMTMFIYYPPKHFCRPPNVSNVKVSQDNCYFYLNQNNSFVKYQCEFWDFDKSQIKSNIVTDLALVCQYRYLQLMITPLKSIALIATIFISFISDIKGRKPMLILSLYLDTIIWIILGIIPVNYVSHILLRCLKIFGSSAAIIGFAYVSEISSPKWRQTLLINYWTSFSLGIAMTSLYMSLTNNWQNAWLLSAIPNIFYLVSPFILVESPQWLIINNRDKEAEEAMEVLNIDLLDQGSNENLIESQNDKDLTYTIELYSFLTSFVLVSRLSVLCFVSFSFYFVYSGLSTDITFASSNIYINAIILGLVEVPSGILGYIASIFLGNLHAMVLGIFLAIIFYIAKVVLFNWHLQSNLIIHAANPILACFIKFMISLSWNIQDVFYAGLIPTTIRSSLSNVGTISGLLGSSLGGFFGYYNIGYFVTTNTIFILLLCISILLMTVVIPSISNKTIPQTVKEAQLIKKNTCSLNST